MREKILKQNGGVEKTEKIALKKSKIFRVFLLRHFFICGILYENKVFYGKSNVFRRNFVKKDGGRYE